MRDIPFVDAHLHLWDLAHIHYSWLSPPFSDDGPNGSTEAIASTYLLDDYFADAKGWTIAGAVHVDAGADAAMALRETEWLSAMAETRGLPSGIVGFAALDDPDVEALLETHAAHPRVRGIRHIVNWHATPKRTYTPRDVTGDPAWQRGFALLGKYGLSFDLQAYAGQFDTLAALFARHPETQVVIDHLGSPIPEERDLWRTEIVKLAALPNVAVKISGVGFIHRPWSLEQVRPYVLDALDLFGTDRCLAASNVPTDKLFGTLDATLSAYAAIIADLSEDERRAIWGRNTNRIYRLGLDV
ncbi:MAG: amidohydrolase family protein [Pseudomonadota bacterium]